MIPGETAPKEDRGLVGIYTPPVSGDNLDTLEANTKRIQQSIGKVPEAKNTLTFLGNWGSSIVMPLEAHKQRNRSAEQIVNSLKPKTEQLPSVDASVWSWDSGLPGVEDARNNSELEFVISTTENFRQLFDATEQFKKILDQSKAFASTRYDLRLDSMGYSVNIDKNALAQLGLTPAQLAKTIEVFSAVINPCLFKKMAYLIT